MLNYQRNLNANLAQQPEKRSPVAGRPVDTGGPSTDGGLFTTPDADGLL